MVMLRDIPEGSPFRADWRKPGADVGKVLWHGRGSTLVKVPRYEGDGWEEITWAHTTEVEPVDDTVFTGFSIGGAPRNRSMAENPCELVHRLCREMIGTPDKVTKETREAVIKTATDQGVNISTAKTQFYHWKAGRA